jgi:DNA-binding beta-propeller fold protein YncE
MHRSTLAAALLFGSCAALTAALDLQPPGPPRSAAPPRVLPGVQPGGVILLPNQWSLRPAGRQRELGDFPVNLALHPGGRWLAALHAGYGEHEIAIVDVGTVKLVCRVSLEQTFYGLAFSPDGKQLFASGGEFGHVHAFAFEDGFLSRHRPLPVARDRRDRFIPGGLAVDRAGRTLYVAGPWGDAVCFLPLADPAGRVTVPLGKDSYPYTCLPDKEGKRLFVSLWAQAAVAVLDVETKKVVATWPTESHPTEMALSPDGKTLFVACANSTRVSVLATDTGKGRETIHCALYPAAPSGNTPNNLSLTPDGELLFVANADANNLAVFNVSKPGEARPLGFIPVGWYPTSVRFNPRRQADLRRQRQGPDLAAQRARPQPAAAAAADHRAAHRRPAARHAQRHRPTHPGKDGGIRQDRLRVQSAAGRPGDRW